MKLGACTLPLAILFAACSAIGLETRSARTEGDVRRDDKPILALSERVPGSPERPIKGAYAITDVNATLEVAVDRDELRRRIERDLGGPDRSLQDELRVKREVMELLLAASATGFEQTQKAIAEPDRVKEVASTISTALAPLIDEDDPNYPRLEPATARLRTRLNETLASVGRQSALAQYEAVCRVFADEAAALRGEVQALAQHEGTFVVFGGWLRSGGKSMPIHIDGFDSYPEGEFFEVSRYALNLGEDTRKEYEAYAKLAKAYNEHGLDGLRDAVKQTLEQELQPLKDCIDHLRGQLDDAAKAAQQAAASQDPTTPLAIAVSALRTHVEQIRDRLRSERAWWDALRDRYRDPSSLASDPIGAALQIQSDVQALRDHVRTLVSDFESDWKKLKDELEAVGDALKSQLQTLLQASDPCVEALKAELAKLEALVQRIRALASHTNVDQKALEFGEEVLRLDVADVPASTSIDLRRTGKRERGDTVTLILAAGKKENAQPKIAASSLRRLDQRELDLYELRPYLDLSVGLVFADPNGTASLSSRFQAGPSYSVLLKRDRADSRLYNELLDPGIGLNFSTLDFNNDEDLELGIAVVVSVFRDYLQVGYGYDINEDRAYFVFGIRLPYTGTTASLGGAGDSP